MNIKELEKIARELRIDIIEMLSKAGCGHSGGSLSVIDLVTALYFHKMKSDPKNPKWPKRDRFIMCKGHCAPAQYAALAKLGFFPREWLWSLRKLGAKLQGHPDAAKTPGIEVSTGSLGQGLSIAVGMAMGLRLNKSKSKVYAILGDGEMYEGQVWEALMNGAFQKLDNLVAFCDRNYLASDDHTENVKALEPLAAKISAFGWHVITINGHDFAQIIKALAKADEIKGTPVFIVAKTVKGKDVSFMENVPKYHGVAPTPEERIRALKDLGVKIEE